MFGDILAIVVHAIMVFLQKPAFCFLMRTPSVLCVLPAKIRSKKGVLCNSSRQTCISANNKGHNSQPISNPWSSPGSYGKEDVQVPPSCTQPNLLPFQRKKPIFFPAAKMHHMAWSCKVACNISSLGGVFSRKSNLSRHRQTGCNPQVESCGWVVL